MPKSENIKRTLTNKKIILGLTALVICLVVITAYSFIPYIIDGSQIKTAEFQTNLAISCSIVLIAMPCAILIGQASNAQDPRSKIAKSKTAFQLTYDKLYAEHKISAFKQWIKKVQQPNDIKEIKERKLTELQLTDLTLLELTEPELKSLINHAEMINNIPYKALTEKQYEGIMKIKSGGLKIKLVPAEYYLTYKHMLSKKTRSERASVESLKKTTSITISVVTKLLITVIVSIIFTLFVRDLSEGIDTGKAIATFSSRLLTFITSIFLGYIVGCQSNDIDSEFIDMRTDTHLEFLEDTTFVAKTEKEEAKEAVIEQMKEEQRIPMLSDKTIYL